MHAELLSRFPIVRAALACVRDAGKDPAALVRRFGLPRTAETDGDIILPLSTFRALLDAVAETTGDPLVGLKVPLRLQRGGYGVFEYLLPTARDVRQMLENTARYTPLVSEVLVATLTVQDGVATVRHEIPGEPLLLGRHGNESLLSMMLSVLRLYTGREITPLRVTLAHREPPTRAALEAALGLEGVTYGAGTNTIALPASALDIPLVWADPVLHGILRRNADAELALRGSESRALGLVKQIVRDQLRDAVPTLEGTASALNVQPRALQRRLKTLDTRFQDVLDRVREEIACARLRDDGATVAELTLELRYADESAFVRAFKRWTGTTPGAYREAHVS